MKLTYRGVHYTYMPNPILAFEPAMALGIYRGVLVPFCSQKDIPKQPSFDLTWRGVPYCSGTNTQETQPTAHAAATHVAAPEGVSAVPAAKIEEGTASTETKTATPKLNVAERARNLFVRHHQKTRQREQSMLSRLNEEVGLTGEDAAHYESHIQGKIPHDFAGYDRSHSAMS